MNTPGELDDSALMAYADGALAPVDAARVEAALAANPAAQARVACFRETGTLLAVYAAIAVPRPQDTWEVARAQASLRRRSWRDLSAMAASLVAALGVVTLLRAGLPAPSGGETTMPREVAAALETVPAGGVAPVYPSSDAATLVPLETFATAGGTFCRNFTLSDATRDLGEGYACRLAPGRWRGRLPEAAGDARHALTAPDVGYAPAGPPSDSAAQLTRARGPVTRLSSSHAATLLEHRWALPATTSEPQSPRRMERRTP